MITKIKSELRRDEGFSLIELLIVVAIIGIIAAIAIPQLMNAMDRGRQRRTMSDMRSIGTATGTYRVDYGEYAPALADLETAPNGEIYMQVVPLDDGWGNALAYDSNDPTGPDTYTLTSLGSDNGAGPAAPDPWLNEPFDPDIVLDTGQFTQAPGQ